MTARTPSRISLRRKRLCNDFASNEPSPKPAKSNQETLEESKVESKDVLEEESSSIQANFMTPKSYHKKEKRRPCQTPTTHECAENKNEETDTEFSPSQSPSQFPSSQMPSSQDWEVVWDCNSPGYSKEELKKMANHQSEKVVSSSFVPLPSSNRLPFSKPKKRPPLPLSPFHLPSRKNSIAVAADLDSLLTKVNCERMQPPNEESIDDEPLSSDISNILNSSSQPFDVTNLEEDLNDSLNNTREDKIEDDTITSVQTSTSLVKIKEKQKNSVKNVNFSSFDDDDLFSESFLISSQALEESVFRKESEKNKSDFNACNRYSPLSKIRKKSPTVIDNDREIKEDKIWEKSNTSFKQNRYDSYINGPVTSSPINQNFNKLNSNIDIHNASKKIGRNLENNLDTDSILNNKSDIKISAKGAPNLKPNKPRATFQLSVPSSQSLHTLMTSKFSGSETLKSSSNRKEVVESLNDSHASNSPKVEKLNRSKSESSHLMGNSSKIKSSDLLMCNRGNLNKSLELDDDDDDEIFASFMPTLIKVEEEHVRKLSQELKPNKVPTTTSRSDIQLNFTTISSSSSMSTQSSSCINSNSRFTGSKFSNFQPKSILSSSSAIQASYVNSNAKEFTRSKTLSSITEKPKILEAKINSIDANPRSLSTVKMKEPSKEKKGSVNVPSIADSFEDDDDDDNIFLQEGVLDYISQVESQFISSQNSPRKLDSNSSTPVKESTDSFTAIKNETLQKGSNESIESKCHKNKLGNDGTSTNRIQKSVDPDSEMLMKEFFKVSETADKLKQALNSDLTSNAKGKAGKKRTTPKKLNAVEAAKSTEISLSDEDLFNITFDTSIDAPPNKPPTDQNLKKNTILFSSAGSSRGNNNNNFKYNNNNCSNTNNSNNNKNSMAHLQGRPINLPNTRSRSLATQNITQTTVGNKINLFGRGSRARNK